MTLCRCFPFGHSRGARLLGSEAGSDDTVAPITTGNSIRMLIENVNRATNSAGQIAAVQRWHDASTAHVLPCAALKLVLNNISLPNDQFRVVELLADRIEDFENAAQIGPCFQFSKDAGDRAVQLLTEYASGAQMLQMAINSSVFVMTPTHEHSGILKSVDQTGNMVLFNAKSRCVSNQSTVEAESLFVPGFSVIAIAPGATDEFETL